MSDQNCDYLTMTGVCGQHQGSLSMTVAGVDVCSLVQQIADVLNVTAINRVFPSGIHRKERFRAHPSKRFQTARTA
jgi:hypothetical protein